jgi:hypothetical protein
MAHMIPLSQPPRLALQRDIIFGGNYLGYEAHAYQRMPQYGEQLDRLRRALGAFATTDNPNQQLIRQAADRRFVRDTAGAPLDFPFRREEGESIVELLADADNEKLAVFVDWHGRRFETLGKAVRETVPEMKPEILKRAERLVSSRLLYSDAPARLVAELSRLDWSHTIEVIDSFDGGIVDGLASEQGIAISHLFEGGWYIGSPTERYKRVLLHELGHSVRMRRGTQFEDIQPLEEALLEHAATVSADDPALQDLAEDMYAAAENEGSYRGLRRLFGLVLHRSGWFPQDISPMITQEDNVALGAAAAILQEGFGGIFREHGDKALTRFLAGYNRAHVMQRDAYIDGWLATALERVGPPDMTQSADAAW